MNKIAFVFPGQGSQSLGMLNDIAAVYPTVEETFTEASSVLGYDLWQLVQEGPAEKLDQTTYTQPALLAASIAILRIIQSRVPFTPDYLAGHSLGEYTALVHANALSFKEAIQLVSLRGKFMQAAVPPDVGAMAAIIGLGEEMVGSICYELTKGSERVLTPANYNSIGQVVIAGHKAEVERAIVLAKEAGAKIALMLPVSVPSHCKLMQPAAVKLAELLPTITIKNPQLKVINNVDVMTYHDKLSIYDGLVRQLYLPVRWVETIQYFATHQVKTIVECGPGKVLTGLNKRIDKSLTLHHTSTINALDEVLATLEIQTEA